MDACSTVRLVIGAIYGHSNADVLPLGTHWHCPEGVAEPCTAQLGDYDIGLHVAALFVLLISSGVGVFLPVIFASKKAARGRFSGSVVYVSNHRDLGCCRAVRAVVVDSVVRSSL